ncbi:MAG TPA: DNA polymerase III subunit delta' [Caulobacteraceae bacterium]
MSSGLPYPRDTYDLEGGEVAERAFLEAMARGRLHHAWLLAGPEGVGKTTFAYRAARRLLGGSPSPAHGLLGVAPEDPVSRLVASKAHPDLLILQRELDGEKPRKQIPVEEARGLPEFFAKTPAMAPWRVAIVDAADDLNPSGANALLKTLEEPPERGIILLVAHRPGALLPTIRSRCRVLKFAPPAKDRTAAWLAARTGVGQAEADQISVMARGAPGRAWRLAGAGALAMDAAARDLLAGLPNTDPAALLALADGFRGAEGAERFAILCDRLADRVHDMASRRVLSMQGAVEGLDAWAEAFEALARLPGEVEAVNLDRGDAFFTAVARLKAAAGRC